MVGVADDVGSLDYGDGAIVLELDLALLKQVSQDVGSALVIGGGLLCLAQLLLQLLDLIVFLVLEDVGKLLNLHLLLHFSLGAAALRADFEEVSATAVGGCTIRNKLELAVR